MEVTADIGLCFGCVASSSKSFMQFSAWETITGFGVGQVKGQVQ